jgi:Ni/Co efflux regulator RcnB
MKTSIIRVVLTAVAMSCIAAGVFAQNQKAPKKEDQEKSRQQQEQPAPQPNRTEADKHGKQRPKG